MDLQDFIDDYEKTNNSSKNKILNLSDKLKLDFQTKISKKKLLNGKIKLTLDEIEILKTIPAKSITKIDLIILALQNGSTIDQITKLLNWQEFEHLVARIFTHVEWQSTTNFRFSQDAPKPSERSRYEVDVIAWKKPFVLIIDCKRYATASKGIIVNAIEKQKERLFELYDRIPVIHDLPELEWVYWEKAILIPMIITWRDHQLQFYDDIPVCAAVALSDYLRKFTEYFDENEWFSLKWQI